MLCTNYSTIKKTLILEKNSEEVHVKYLFQAKSPQISVIEAKMPNGAVCWATMKI